MEENKKKNSSILIVIAAIMFIAISFTCGYYMNDVMSNNNKCLVENNTTEKEISETKENVEIKSLDPKQEVNVRDTFAISTYGGVLQYYTISKGKVYYRFSKDTFVGLNVCPSSNSYCQHNSTYNNELTEINEIENALKIKYAPDIHASGEEFIVFVITDSKVYSIKETIDLDGNYTGVKVEEVTELSNKNIVDLVDIENKTYIFTNSNNEQIKY